MAMRRGEVGITLIELAVVMAIVAIAAVFMAPALGEWIDNYRIRQAAREVSSDLQLTKMKAISMGRNCTVLFNQNIGGTLYAYVIFPEYDNIFTLDNVDEGDLDGDGDQENETTDIIKMAVLNRNIVFDPNQGGTDNDGIDFPDEVVTFNPQGMPRDNSGSVPMPNSSIFLKNEKNKKCRRVTVSPAGRISTNEY